MALLTVPSALRASSKYLKPLARVCLLATFFDDGFRMFFQWGDQVQYIKTSWGVGWFLAVVFVLFNMFGQVRFFIFLAFLSMWLCC